VCRAKVRRVDTFALLIGSDTYTKTTFVKDEVDVAIEKGCRLIGVDLNSCRFKDGLCPSFFADKSALFVPFSSRILAEALKWNKPSGDASLADDWSFRDQTYIDIEKGHFYFALTLLLGGVDTPALIRYGRAAEWPIFKLRISP